ncbi:hypothetical protein FK268_00090 [Tsukamurella sputi]|uniref:DUF998 domain-containing protein n=1 Tax=Tsukamurella sputi TaxID=2591848 RepID=A0A5C5RT66_9ACTN|nr:hypothetical protein [Tsukamurella sputi]TWS25720.1 hypothetical protein FK268_00090 [Tsukamurella sputi]
MNLAGQGRLKAAWTLALLAPLCAELTFTAVAVPATWLALPILVLIYGAGVLLIREAVVRVGGGWPSLITLGLAYELAEDGLGLQALTSPTMYGAGEWGWRVGGLNLTYWEAQVGVHTVFSVLVPIMLVGVIFPQHRARPFLRTGGMIGVGITAILGVAVVRLTISVQEDPGYNSSVGTVIVFTVAVAALAAVALAVLPRVALPAVTPLPATCARVGLVSGIACAAFLFLLMPPGLRKDTGPALSGLLPHPILLALAAFVAVVAAALLLRFAADPGFDDLHRIWLAGGIGVAHTLFMTARLTPTTITAGAITVVLEIGALALLARRVRSRRTSATREHAY